MNRVAHSLGPVRLAFACLLVLSMAAPAQALLTLEYRSSKEIVQIGETFDVDVFATFDGRGPNLIVVVASAIWEPAYRFVSATSGPSILFQGDPGSRELLTNSFPDQRPRSFPNDPVNSLRTIAFVAPGAGFYAAAGGPTLITRLTFELTGLNPEGIQFGFLTDDGIFSTGPGGSTPLPESDNCFIGFGAQQREEGGMFAGVLHSPSRSIGCPPPVPEPGTGLLLGFGIGLLGLRRR